MKFLAICTMVFVLALVLSISTPGAAQTDARSNGYGVQQGAYTGTTQLPGTGFPLLLTSGAALMAGAGALLIKRKVR